jgi:hypothetical protein
MAKRFTDTDKWKKQWFRKLTPEMKCFWIYLCDNCNHAGVWDVDLEAAGIFIGAKLEEQAIMDTFGHQVTVIDSGKKWFIKNFIIFQYKVFQEKLNPLNKVHKSVIDILVIDGLASPCQGAKDKDKAKAMEMDMGKDMEKEKDMDKDFPALVTKTYINDDGGHKLKIGDTTVGKVDLSKYDKLGN